MHALLAYWYFLVQFSTADESAFLEIAGENIAAKLFVLVAVPGNVLLVHLDGLLVERERVGVVEQAPGDEAAGHDGRAAVFTGGFRLTICYRARSILVQQLLVVTTLHVPGVNVT